MPEENKENKAVVKVVKKSLVRKSYLLKASGMLCVFVEKTNKKGDVVSKYNHCLGKVRNSPKLKALVKKLGNKVRVEKKKG